MKITEHQLRRLIREAVQNHIDGHPFPGTLEDLAKCHAGAWGHGTVVDPSRSIEMEGERRVGRSLHYRICSNTAKRQTKGSH